MYAIIKTGGKQYRVAVDDTIDVELLDVGADSKVEFKEVLFVYDAVSPKIGEPIVAGCVVKGELVDEIRGPKILSMKYKKRKKQYRKFGHRQDYHRIKITAITI